MFTCFKCKRQIEEGSNYFEFREFIDSQLIHSDYCHKECWDQFKDSVTNVEEAKGLIRGLKLFMIRQGILPQEKFVVQ